ncbi:3-dehydroquinate synthase [Candidatus Pelagibacter sp.]|nr:3-dehydroquinate synthase [Candidatus Pelagibacter sp.]
MRPIKIKIKTESEAYSIIIGSNIIKSLSRYLRNNQINFNKCILIIDKKIPSKKISLITNSLKGKEILKYYFNSNEKNKNFKNINSILNIMLKKNFSRKDCLISIGGGITGDVGSFAASIFKRGMQFINLPTTLLSQVDSSIGGKTGINSKYGKNLVGSFYQPKIVISDINFLTTLPAREIICGYGEILKHSLIKNKKFYNFLDQNASKILSLKSPYIQKAIIESCKIKRDVVQKDEHETGLRKILNFGHTFAHAYEASLGYSKKLNHGEAVILGIKSAVKFSLKEKFIQKKEYESIMNHLYKNNLPSELNKYFSVKDLNKILSFMTKDKKNTSKKINLILLKKIGSSKLDYSYHLTKLKKFLKKELIN